MASPNTADFSFATLSDFHHDSPECDAWHETLFKKVAAYQPAFVLGLGDLSNAGAPSSLSVIRRIAAHFEAPFYPVPGNHDCDLEMTTAIFAKIFPEKLNYSFTHSGWQFIGLDTTDGDEWLNTRISDVTLAWLDAEIPRLDPLLPTVAFTHFPLAAELAPIDGKFMSPRNTSDVLSRLRKLNLRAALSGHYHANTERAHGAALLATSACCGRVVRNHDGHTPRGWWLYHAHSDGMLSRTFVPIDNRSAA